MGMGFEIDLVDLKLDFGKVNFRSSKPELDLSVRESLAWLPR